MALDGPASRSISDLETPPRLPVVGNLHKLLHADRVVLKIEEWCKAYGPVFRLDLGPQRALVLADPDDIATVLRERPDVFRRGGDLETVFRETGTPGVFSEEGDSWRRSRRLVVTALNSNHLQRNFHPVRTAGERLRAKLEGEAESGRSIDIDRVLSDYTVDVICAIAFGHDLKALEGDESPLQRHIERQLAMLSRRVGAPIPYWRWFRLPSDRAWERSFAELHRAVADFIAAARERMKARPELREQPENLLESMLAVREADGGLTDEEIVGNTFTLLIAGEGTTAHTMAWTIWFLARNPEMQDRWASEAIEVLGDAPVVDEYEKLARLSYGDAVLRESMRLKSVSPLTSAEPLTEVTVAGVRIPAGTQILAMLRYAGLHESGIERPLEFDPERWLGDENAAPDQRSFLAFGAGPRFCPGRNLSFVEMKAAMAMIARNFEIDLDESGGPVQERLNFAMYPKNLRVRLRLRAVASAVPGV